MYSVALDTTIALQDLLIECQTAAPDPTSVSNFIDYLENPNVKPKYGGALYISDAALVTS